MTHSVLERRERTGELYTENLDIMVLLIYVEHPSTKLS